MTRFFEYIGRLVERLRGPRTTTVVVHDRAGRQYSFQHTVQSDLHAARIVSERLVYRVNYSRWWIPDVEYCVFRVQGYVDDSADDALDDGKWKENIPPAFFEPNYYPSMVGLLLRWSRHPHMYAIHAHMDRYHFYREDKSLP